MYFGQTKVKLNILKSDNSFENSPIVSQRFFDLSLGCQQTHVQKNVRKKTGVIFWTTLPKARAFGQPHRIHKVTTQSTEA